MKSIDRKMIRELRGMRGQALAIALVIISGVATFVAFRGTMASLDRTLRSYYAEYRFADVFSSVRRAPENIREQIRLIPDVSQVQTRVVATANLEVRGFNEPVSGQFVSIPENAQPGLNQLFLRKGRLVRSGYENEVVVNEAFTDAHHLDINDRFTAILNGRRRELIIVGIALSPEYLMAVKPGGLFPDPQRFGVMWMGREALSAAYDMEGAFNNVVLSVAPGGNSDEVIDHLDVILKTYGGPGAIARKDQPSHFYISAELKQLATMATILPTIFLGVAVFLLNIVISRLIHTQRELIGTLKAFGYTNRDIGIHYVKLVLVITVTGIIVGLGLGTWLGRNISEMYMQFYRFPYLTFQMGHSVFLSVALLTVGSVIFGVLNAVRRAANLPPAEAMRPAAPARYRETWIERIGLRRILDEPTRMIARQLERQPVKSLLTVVGIALSCAILIMGRFFNDAFDYMIEVQYGLAQREDLTITYTEPTSLRSFFEIRRLRGVRYAEPTRVVPVRFRHEHRVYDSAIEGIPLDSHLRYVLDTDLNRVPIPTDGIVLTERLASILDVRAGSEVEIEVLEGNKPKYRVRVVRLAQQYLGVSSYMNLDRLNHLSGYGQAYSGALLLIDHQLENDVVRTLQRRPRVVEILSQERAIKAFNDSSAQTALTFAFVLTLFAGAIAFSVVYNSGRIALSERERELASLRVLGFSKGEIAYILLGEQVILTFIAIPVGFLLGTGLSLAIVQALQTDLYSIPLVLRSGTFAFAAIVVLLSLLVSAVFIRRKLNRLDLVGVLKTRE